MKTYIIHIHSFVDLITNSSTEIYIQATDKTVASIKEIINNILEMGGSDATCDDLFVISTFNLDERGYESYRDIYLNVKSKDPNNELGKKTAKILSSLTSIFDMEAECN